MTPQIAVITTAPRFDAEIRTALAALLGGYAAAGSLRPGADVDGLADAVPALADGLAMRLLYTPSAADRLRATLDTALGALLREPPER